ncbi:hypothetical protein QVD17_20484 [Tagetes erecta]|uniref:RING-type E3 ubiquitin transferase n=1 Tax=Tagetes erecta TaxID=13708 RepID=A0AAD8KLT8_TARER|nr:hypothetical protein QVD17_20484 [Tagetes erecta]
MKPNYQINLSTIIFLITSNKSSIIITITTIIILHRILKTLHHHRQFPIFTAKQSSTLYCAVCLHDVDTNQKYRRVPQCYHCFHVACIDTWLQSRSTCPLCRNQIPLHLLPRKQNKEHGFCYLFLYFALKALRQRIFSGFSKLMIFDADCS